MSRCADLGFRGPRRVGLDIVDNFWAVLLPVLLYLSWGALNGLLLNYAYWIVGQLADDLTVATRYVGCMKCVSCVWAAIGWWMSGVDSGTQVGVNIALLLLTIPFTFEVACSLGGGFEIETARATQQYQVGFEMDEQLVSASPAASGRAVAPELRQLGAGLKPAFTPEDHLVWKPWVLSCASGCSRGTGQGGPVTRSGDGDPIHGTLERRRQRATMLPSKRGTTLYR